MLDSSTPRRTAPQEQCDGELSTTSLAFVISVRQVHPQPTKTLKTLGETGKAVGFLWSSFVRE